MSTSDLNELRRVSAGHRHDANVTISNAVFAELIVRASSAELRNKGILLQLSASGGRNIDLRKRVEDAESALVELKPADVLVEGLWFAVADLPAVLGNHMRAADQYARDAKESFIRAESAEARTAGVLEMHKRVWHEWTELDGRPGSGWICDHCTPTGRVSVVTMHPCPTFTAAAGDAANEWIVINGMGGTVCSACGDPTESEPCQEHQPVAYKECTS